MDRNIVSAVRLGAKGRAVIPAPVRQAAGLKEGASLIAVAEGAGRIVLETPEAVQARVWAAAAPVAEDARADVRALRQLDKALDEANFARRSREPDELAAAAAGARLLAELGL